MESMPSSTRRSKRKKLPSIPIQNSSYKKSTVLQLQFERIIESPGGTAKTLNLVQSASGRDIDELNACNWTPLVGVVFRLGKNTTKNGNTPESEELLAQLINACHVRGISLNSGAWFGEHYHRPLVLAAYYGYSSAVRRLIELGAHPDLGDGEGRNVWFAAFQNPVASGGTHRLRECDEQTAKALLELGVVTNDLGKWRRTSPKGSLCYMNGDSACGSVMLHALLNENFEAVMFLCDAGGSISDRDYLMLRHKRRLLHMVGTLLLASRGKSFQEVVTIVRDTTAKSLIQNVKSWSQEIDWSFPPTWKVCVALCQNCGLSPEIFRSYVVPYLDRDWFYTDKSLPPLLGPSLGERVGACRGLEWMSLDAK